MSKRKRNPNSDRSDGTINSECKGNTAKVIKTNGQVDVKTNAPVIQIITGSYESVLHGISATIHDDPVKETVSVEFSDTFLFNAHASAIRCLALSQLPEANSSENPAVFLASGGTDERINVYSLAASPVTDDDIIPLMPSLGSNKICENPRNRELGSLMHHSSSITALHFPTRSKLLSASEDNTITISRTKDLTVVSSIKVPHPKAMGQPSGDTSPPGAIPAGVNDFAVHPSMKLMVSVGKREKCMRLWNLVTGKKAGVLNFDRGILQSIKESKYNSGEGRRINWNPNGSEFVVAFERGAVVFGEDSKPRCKILPLPLTKLHQIHYFDTQSENDNERTMLAVSTEDGRILFYSTSNLVSLQGGRLDDIPDARVVGELGGKKDGVNVRIKDFEIILLQGTNDCPTKVLIITACSDGAIKVWQVSDAQLRVVADAGKVEHVGKLIGTYESGSRITCVKAFLMQQFVEAGLPEYEGLNSDPEDSSSGSGSSDSE